MKNLSFINKIIYFINIIVVVLILLSFVLPFLPPKTFSILSVLNLGVSFLILVNILCFFYWLFSLKTHMLLSLIVILIGYFYFGSLYKFPFSKKIKNSDSIKVMNYNVRLFNLYDWLPEKDLEIKIVDFVKSASKTIFADNIYTL